MGVWVHRATTTTDIPDGGVATVDIADLAVTAAKLAANAVETAKILDANVTTAKILDANVTTAKIADANVTGAKQSVTAQTKVFTYQIEDLAAGADIASRQIWQTPQGGVCDIVRVEFHFSDATVGVDGANTLQIVLDVAGAAVADTGALTANQAADTVNAPVLANNTGIAVGSAVDISITQGAAADAGLIQVIVYYTQAA